MTASRPRLVTTKSHFDIQDWVAPLQQYVSDQLGTPVTISEVYSPTGSGMSGTSVLFTATWHHGRQKQQRLVARVMPHPDDLPVFPDNDVGREATVMTTVRESTGLPVPRVWWHEPSDELLGCPFMIIEAMPGQAPPDNPPYLFGGWLADASPEQQARLEQSTVEVLAQVHAAPVPDCLLPNAEAADSPLGRHLADSTAYYEWTVATDGIRVPVLDEAFAWLHQNRPADTDQALLWGDSRIGNILYTDFEPSAVLDWEYARYGPREADLGWLIGFHAMFQDLAETHGAPGMPGLLKRERITELYAAASGHTPQSLDYHLTYAVVRYGVIHSRITRRSVLMGDREPVTDPDELVMHHRMIRQLLEGSYRWH